MEAKLTAAGREWALREADAGSIIGSVALDGTGWPAPFVETAISLCNKAGGRRG